MPLAHEQRVTCDYQERTPAGDVQCSNPPVLRGFCAAHVPMALCRGCRHSRYYHACERSVPVGNFTRPCQCPEAHA